MALITAVIGVILGLLGLFWLIAKLLKWSFHAENPKDKKRVYAYINQGIEAFQLVLLVVVLIELGPSIGSALIDGVQAIVSLW